MQEFDEIDLLFDLFDITDIASLIAIEFDKAKVYDEVITLSDQYIISSILSEELYREWVNGDNYRLFSLSFVIRYKLTVLSMYGHAIYLIDQNKEIDNSLRGKLVNFDEFIPLFRMIFLKKDSGFYPVFGFSALGIHAVRQKVGYCRSFDKYSDRCSEETDELFCHTHKDEAWWGNHSVVSNSKELSVDLNTTISKQAEMFNFYFNLDNLKAIDNKNLDKMISDFWSLFEAWRIGNNNEVQLKRSANYLGIDSDNLKCINSVSLRSIFLSLAKKIHPDHGGDSSEFIKLKKHYDILRKSLLFKEIKSNNPLT